MFITSAGEPPNWNKAIRTVVRAIRLDADLSQQELADPLHVSRSVIAHLEAGRRAIQASELPSIARALRCSPETLVRRILAWATGV